MDLKTFHQLLIPHGQEAMQSAMALKPREEDYLADFQVLSRSYPPALARAALEVAILRRKAKDKFPFADKLYFTREALEQASAHEVSTYRAERFHFFRLLVDLGCSVGGDTLALAAITPTLAIDLDRLRLAMAQANLEALGLQERTLLVQADITKNLPVTLPPESALFFDPARRARRQRFFSVKDYIPPLDVVREWLRLVPALGVKISPRVDLKELQSYDVEVEFISLRGDLKEATLWFGPLRTASRRATVLPGPHTMSVDEGLRYPNRSLALSEPKAYLYEPDPAVLRAGLVAELGITLGGVQLDPDIAYLTANQFTPTPFARAWEVEAWFPFGLKRLREYLRERGVGRVVVKKRGSPLQPEALIRDLRLEGEEERIIFLTHLRGKPIVVVCF